MNTNRKNDLIVVHLPHARLCPEVCPETAWKQYAWSWQSKNQRLHPGLSHYKSCDLGNDQLHSGSAEEGFGGTTSHSLEEQTRACSRTLLLIRSRAGRCGQCGRGAAAEAPWAPALRSKALGAAGACVPPSLLGGDPQPCLEKGTQRRRWGSPVRLYGLICQVQDQTLGAAMQLAAG